jgi:transcriptional regulator with XRE-family HTH domain
VRGDRRRARRDGPFAKACEQDVAARVGRGVRLRRAALGLSAVQLAQKASDFGYPISRVAVSKIESGTRAGKLDVAELLVLAAALVIPPVLLLYPGYPDEVVTNLPDRPADSRAAALWCSGLARAAAVGLSDDYNPNPGEDLLEDDELVITTEAELRQQEPGCRRQPIWPRSSRR